MGSERNSPAQSRLRLETFSQVSEDSKTQHLAPRIGIVSNQPGDDQESERASASEAEEDMDSASE